MLEIRQVTIDEVLEEIKPLLAANADEMTKGESFFNYKPRIDIYHQLEINGNLLVIAAFKDNILVGYTVNFIDKHMHYSDLLFCTNNIIYVDPKHRNSRIALKLMKKTEAFAKKINCDIMEWHGKKDTTMHKLLEAKNYNCYELIFFKEL